MADTREQAVRICEMLAEDGIPASPDGLMELRADAVLPPGSWAWVDAGGEAVPAGLDWPPWRAR